MRSGDFARLRREAGWLRLFGAATLARTANEMLPVAGVLYVIDRTGEAALAGLLVAAVTLPSLVSGPLLGRWLDRLRRPSRLMAADQVVMGASLVVIVGLIEAGAPWLSLLPALAAGITFPLSTAGFTTLLPSFVRSDLLPAANAVEASSYSFALVSGPAIAGAVSFAAGPLAAVWLQLALKLAALVLIAGVRDPVRGRSDQEAGSVRAGLRAIRDVPALLGVTAGSAVALAGRGCLVIAFPLFATAILDLERAVAGFLWAALAGGAIAGSLGLARRLHGRPQELVALGSFACAGGVMALWPLMGSPAPALVLVAAAGVAMGPGLGAQIGLRQQHVPEQLQGQVFMTAASLKVASYAVGAALAGALAGAGATAVVLAAAGLHLAGAATGALLVRRSAPVRAAAAQHP
jgi:MFS family permease